MRITYQEAVNSLVSQIHKHQGDIFRTQQVLMDGVEIKKPSDDPLRANRAMRLEDTISRTNQFEENIALTTNKLQYTESELRTAQDIFVQARSLTVQASTGTLSDADRDALATEVDQHLLELISIANARHGDSYIFGGFNTRSAPYEMITDPATGDVIQVRGQQEGMDGVMYTTVSKDSRVQSNIPGSDVFQTGQPGGDGDAFQVLIDLRDKLRANDIDGLEDSIAAIDNAMDSQNSAVLRVGTFVERLQNADQRLQDNEVTDEDALSKARDADIAEWTQKYQLQQLAYANSLKVGSDLISISLLNFIM